MAKKDDDDRKKPESLSRQFSRFAARMKRRWNGEQIMLEDINTIKLPAVESYGSRRTPSVSYFASRNRGGKWDVEQQDEYGGEYLHSKKIATDLELPELLDFLAEKNPDSMKVDTTKYWHPASVGLLIGHTFKNNSPSKPSAPAAAP